MRVKVPYEVSFIGRTFTRHADGELYLPQDFDEHGERIRRAHSEKSSLVVMGDGTTSFSRGGVRGDYSWNPVFEDHLERNQKGIFLVQIQSHLNECISYSKAWVYPFEAFIKVPKKGVCHRIYVSHLLRSTDYMANKSKDEILAGAGL